MSYEKYAIEVIPVPLENWDDVPIEAQGYDPRVYCLTAPIIRGPMVGGTKGDKKAYRRQEVLRMSRVRKVIPVPLENWDDVPVEAQGYDPRVYCLTAPIIRGPMVGGTKGDKKAYRRQEVLRMSRVRKMRELTIELEKKKKEMDEIENEIHKIKKDLQNNYKLNNK